MPIPTKADGKPLTKADAEYLVAEKKVLNQQQRQALRAAYRMSLDGSRPLLTAPTVVAYLDWVTRNEHMMHPERVKLHLHAAELAIRTLAVEAQGKATQHTLVEQGIIDPPPKAS